MKTKGRIVYARFGRRARKLTSKSTPRVLLLQGPVGPFFQQLQTKLNESGYDAWRLCFTSGDRLFSNRHKRITYNQGMSEWPSWLEQFLTYSDIDCIVLFGCERPVHKLAIHVAQRRNIQVVSMEEGYIRPGYVTVEYGGNNRMSPLAGSLPPIDFEPSSCLKKTKSASKSFSKMCWYGFRYYSYNFLSGFNQRATFHKNRSLTGESFCWTRNLFRKVAHQGLNFGTVERLLEHYDKKYFVVPLQVSDDSQLRSAAKGWTNEKMILAAISSFASHAQDETRLVFKIHPLDRGHSTHAKLIRSIATLHKIADRIDIIDTGSLGLLVRHSAGMLTINSTSGLSAIAHAIPLLVFGEAIYSDTPFAYRALRKEEIHSFWRNTHAPDRSLCGKYIAWLRENCLKPGDFYDNEGILAAIDGVMEKIAAITPTNNKFNGELISQVENENTSKQA